MSSILMNRPGREEAKPDIHPMASMERLETICPRDCTNCPSISSKADSSEASMCSADCPTVSNSPLRTGST